MGICIISTLSPHINLYSFPHRRIGRRRIRIFARVPFRPSPGRCHRRRCRRLLPPTRRAWVQHHQVKSERPSSGFIQWAHSHSHTRTRIVSYRITPPSVNPLPQSSRWKSCKITRIYWLLHSIRLYLSHPLKSVLAKKNQKKKKETQKSKLQITNQTRSVQEVICAFGSFPFQFSTLYIFTYIYIYIAHNCNTLYTIYDIFSQSCTHIYTSYKNTILKFVFLKFKFPWLYRKIVPIDASSCSLSAFASPRRLHVLQYSRRRRIWRARATDGECRARG